MKGILIVLSGPSGVGKGTVCKALLRDLKDVVCSISATTRLPREGEKNGVNYYFVSTQRFQEMIANNEFLEWAKVYDNFYGTPRFFVEEALKKGKNVLLEIDVQGGIQVKQKFAQAALIFLLPPTWDELKARLIRRASESPEEIKKRLEWAKKELHLLLHYDYAVINDNLKEAVFKIKSILVAEKCRVLRLNMEGRHESTTLG